MEENYTFVTDLDRWCGKHRVSSLRYLSTRSTVVIYEVVNLITVVISIVGLFVVGMVMISLGLVVLVMAVFITSNALTRGRESARLSETE